MIIALSELKINIGKYVDIAEKQDIHVESNSKQVAEFIGINRDREAEMESLFGITRFPHEYDNPNYDSNYEKLRDERVEK